MRRVHWRIPLAALAILAPACGGDTPSPTAPDQRSQSPASPEMAFIVVAFPADPPSAGAFGDGRYRVNADVKPGRYFTRVTDDNCSYERKSAAPPPGDLIGGSFFSAGGQSIVDVLATDTWFETSGCGLWSTTPNGGLQQHIGPGMWLVGTQIAAGRYHSNGSSSGACTWSRLDDVRNTASSASTQGSVPAGTPATVTISPDDVAFESNNCSAWSPAP